MIQCKHQKVQCRSKKPVTPDLPAMLEKWHWQGRECLKNVALMSCAKCGCDTSRGRCRSGEPTFKEGGRTRLNYYVCSVAVKRSLWRFCAVDCYILLLLELLWSCGEHRSQACRCLLFVCLRMSPCYRSMSTLQTPNVDRPCPHMLHDTTYLSVPIANFLPFGRWESSD